MNDYRPQDWRFARRSNEHDPNWLEDSGPALGDRLVFWLSAVMLILVLAGVL